jgi:type I restriction enzyme R subunit
MPTPSEHKTVQARILAYAEAIRLRQGYGGQVGWTIVSREEAEQRRGFDPDVPPAERARKRSLFGDVRDAESLKSNEFNLESNRRQ